MARSKSPARNRASSFRRASAKKAPPSKNTKAEPIPKRAGKNARSKSPSLKKLSKGEAVTKKQGNVLLIVLHGIEMVLLAIILLVAVLCVPPINRCVFCLLHKAPSSIFKYERLVSILPIFVYCKGDYLTCVKNEWMAKHYPLAYGWESGRGATGFNVDSTDGSGPNYFSHAAYKEVAHSPTAGRFNKHFIMSDMNELPPGVVPKEIVPAVLNLNTNDPEHKARRLLMVDLLDSLQKDPETSSSPPMELKVPPGITNEDGSDSTKVVAILAYNLFRELFGVELSVDQLKLLAEYDGNLARV